MTESWSVTSPASSFHSVSLSFCISEILIKHVANQSTRPSSPSDSHPSWIINWLFVCHTGPEEGNLKISYCCWEISSYSNNIPTFGEYSSWWGDYAGMSKLYWKMEQADKPPQTSCTEPNYPGIFSISWWLQNILINSSQVMQLAVKLCGRQSWDDNLWITSRNYLIERQSLIDSKVVKYLIIETRKHENFM